MRKAFSLEKIPLLAVIIHSFLIVIVVGLGLLPSSNSDSSIGFVMMVLVGYVIDYPIGMLIEIMRPSLGASPMGVILVISTYLVLGGLYWFLIFSVIAMIGKAIRKKIVHK